jgi:hypothetical protein
MKDQSGKLLGDIAAIMSALVLIYFLTAPPLINLSGGTSFPAVYQPVKVLLENYQYGGPLRWYFDSAWHSDVKYVRKIGITSSLAFPIWVFGVGALFRLILLPMRRVKGSPIRVSGQV